MSSSLRVRLAQILGKRAFFAFGIVTLLVAGLLAAINLASHYALKLYIEDQLSRLSWDIALYQTTDFTISAEVSPELRKIAGIQRVESLSFLRSKPPPEAILMVDGKPLASPWVSILSATEVSLLPPEARLEGEASRAAAGLEARQKLIAINELASRDGL